MLPSWFPEPVNLLLYMDKGLKVQTSGLPLQDMRHRGRTGLWWRASCRLSQTRSSNPAHTGILDPPGKRLMEQNTESRRKVSLEETDVQSGDDQTGRPYGPRAARTPGTQVAVKATTQRS